MNVVTTYSADFDSYSVDVTIKTSGGTYHIVEIVRVSDDGRGYHEVHKFFSRAKAVAFAEAAVR